MILAASLALVAAVALVEAWSALRVPIGLLTAIYLVSLDAAPPVAAALGAAGVVLARLWFARSAAAARRRRSASAPGMPRPALGSALAGSRTAGRASFVLGAAPFVPSTVLFPILAALGAPLRWAIAGTLVGRFAVLLVTTTLFALLGYLLGDAPGEPPTGLAIVATTLVVLGLLRSVEWQHRSATGRWRIREEHSPLEALALRLAGNPTTGRPQPATRPRVSRRTPAPTPAEPGDEIEGVVIAEEIVDDAAGPDADRSPI